MDLGHRVEHAARPPRHRRPTRAATRRAAPGSPRAHGLQPDGGLAAPARRRRSIDQSVRRSRCARSVSARARAASRSSIASTTARWPATISSSSSGTCAGRPRQLAELQVQLHLLHGQPHRLGARGQLDVEAAVGPPLLGDRLARGPAGRRCRAAGRSRVRDARDAASRAAAAATAPCTSPELAQVRGAELGQPRVGELGEGVVPGRARSCRRRGPRRVSTSPSLRRSASASRRVTVETLSIVARSVSVGSCSPSPSRPSAMALPTRRTTASLRSAPSSSGREHRAARVAAEHLHAPTSSSPSAALKSRTRDRRA